MRARTASCTDDDIKLLKTRVVTSSDPTYPADALHVLKTNTDVDSHNLSHIRTSRSRIYEIKAIDKRKDVHTGQLDVVMPTKSSDTGGLREVVMVTEGARVMVTVNINVSDGLANGVCGTVVGIETTGDQVIVILVKFDSPRVGKDAIAQSQYRQRYPDAVPIIRQEVQFFTGRGRQSVEARRTQFPLTLAWACTIHKVQGKTLEQIVVSMEGRGKFMPGQAYVAMSRVRTLQGLFFLGFDACHILINPVVQREMDRLNNIPKREHRLEHYETENRCVNIGFLNVRSYLEHLDDMKNDAAIRKMGVLCFAETFLYDGQRLEPEKLLKNGVKCFRAERPLDHGIHRGGILMMAPEGMTPASLDTPATVLEHQGISIKTHRTTINIVTVYRPPSQSPTIFKDRLQQLLTTLNTENLTVLLGDFNFDLLHTPDHDILKLMTHHGFRQCVTGPTTDQGSLLDHVYVNHPVTVHVEVVDTYYSDHDIICVSLEM